MPASMMIAPAGFMWKVSGSSMATVAGGPSPGSTPTTVPRSTPTKHQSRLVGSSATPKPWARLARISTLEPDPTRGQRYAERQRKHRVEAERARDRRRRGDLERPPVHHGDDEEAEQPEAQREAEDVRQRDGHGEREPHEQRAPDAGPRERRGRGARDARPHAGDDQRGGEDHHRNAVPQGEEPGARAVGPQVLPLRGLDDDVDAERREREPGPQVGGFLRRLFHAPPPRRRLFTSSSRPCALSPWASPSPWDPPS